MYQETSSCFRPTLRELSRDMHLINQFSLPVSVLGACLWAGLYKFRLTPQKTARWYVRRVQYSSHGHKGGSIRGFRNTGHSGYFW